jgi:cyclopropane fatty-acyl-phospholipid synthase-like methyltransferase
MREHAERAGIKPGMYVREIGCGLGGTFAVLQPNAVVGWRRSTSRPTSFRRHAS